MYKKLVQDVVHIGVLKYIFLFDYRCYDFIPSCCILFLFHFNSIYYSFLLLMSFLWNSLFVMFRSCYDDNSNYSGLWMLIDSYVVCILLLIVYCFNEFVLNILVMCYQSKPPKWSLSIFISNKLVPNKNKQTNWSLTF